jgi:truncated hemoglobin YjbI
LRDAEKRRLAARGEVRYGKLYSLLGGEMETVERLSAAFYARVFAQGPAGAGGSSSFRDAFVESAGSAAQAAANQSEWFAAYWGKHDVSAGQEAVERGRLVAQLLPKHPSAVMIGAHAVTWLALMGEAVIEALLPAPRPGGRRLVLAEAVLRFALHFLAFFDFTPRELSLQRMVVEAWCETHARACADGTGGGLRCARGPRL